MAKKPDAHQERPRNTDQHRKEAAHKWMERRKKQGWKRKDVWVPPGHVVRIVPASQTEENCVQAKENAPAQNRVDNPGLLRELFNDAAAKAAEMQDRLNDVLAEKEQLAKECERLRLRISSREPLVGKDGEKDDGSSLALDALIRWREAVLRMGLIDRLLARWPQTQQTTYPEDLEHA